ncbi:septal ring lytic transglycosylase RlpA family protein [Tumidithrix helvetica PCC 7403]
MHVSVNHVSRIALTARVILPKLQRPLYSKQFTHTGLMQKHLINLLFFALTISAFPLALSFSSDTATAQTDKLVKSDKQTETIPSTSDARSNVLKVGETRSRSMARSQEDAIAKIYPHKIDERQAATVYVRGIPVLTFVSSLDAEGNKISKTNAANNLSTGQAVKLNSAKATKLPSQTKTESEPLASNDPVERATAAAALINQLSQEGLDASAISPAWESGNYVIKFGDRAALKFDESLILPQTTRNKAEDLLQATNLLRRLMGGATPVNGITNAPTTALLATNQTGADFIGQVTEVGSGLASWYGPGFEGAYSASGELFNTNDLTAAHRTLPFGTKVRVTNMDNGKSVVVRINDRGPFSGDRILDMSKGSAEVIDLIHAGVAQVKLEVLIPAVLTGSTPIK